jgi:hypothetical protein
MNVKKWSLVVVLIILISISACDSFMQTGNKDALETQQEATLQKKLEEAQASTAIFETSVAKALTEQAPPPTATFTSTPVPTDTPSSTDTPLPTDTPEPTETPLYSATPTTDPHPWVMQDWCLEHVGCGKYAVVNQTDSWLQLTAKELETGYAEFFSIRKSTTGYITLRPGKYRVEFRYWCNNKKDTYTVVWPLSGMWTDYFKCPGGYHHSEHD